MVDLPLPLSPMSDTTSPGATSKLTSWTAEQLAAAESADAVRLAAGVDPQHQAAAFQHAAA